MRERAAHEYGVQRVRQIEIADELAAPGQETPVLATQYRAADERVAIADQTLNASKASTFSTNDEHGGFVDLDLWARNSSGTRYFITELDRIESRHRICWSELTIFWKVVWTLPTANSNTMLIARCSSFFACMSCISCLASS